MSKIPNFHKISFAPFMITRGNITVANYYKASDGTLQSWQSHLSAPAFSHWEVLRDEPNPMYGKEDEYRQQGYVESGSGEYLEKDYHSIQRSLFTRKTTRYTLAYWDNLNHDDCTPDLVFVGNRPFRLNKEDREIFMFLSSIAQEELERQLKLFIRSSQTNGN